MKYPVALYFAHSTINDITEMKEWLRQRVDRDLYRFHAHIEQIHFANEQDAILFRLAFEGS